MKKFEIIIIAYLSAVVFSNAHCSYMTSAKESVVLEDLEVEQINQIRNLRAAGINATDSQGRTPLFLAAQYNQVQIIKELLLNKDIEIDKPDNDGLTPLAIAINDQHLEVVQTLLDSNSKEQFKIANIESLDKRVGYSPLARAAMTGNEKIIKLLLTAGANPAAIVTREGKDLPIAQLCKAHDKEAAELLKNKANEYTQRGLAVIEAVRKQKPDEARELIAQGIDVHAQSLTQSALHFAAIQGYKELVVLLIEKKAGVNAKDYRNNTPINLAAMNGHKDVAEQLIINNANIHIQSCLGETPLYWAASKGHIQIVELLINNKVNVDSVGETPLLHAVEKGHIAIVAMLINNKADVNVKNSGAAGYRPLHKAVETANKDIVQMLIAAKADVNVKDKFGITPLVLAYKKNQKDMVDMLERAGATKEGCAIC